MIFEICANEPQKEEKVLSFEVFGCLKLTNGCHKIESNNNNNNNNHNKSTENAVVKFVSEVLQKIWIGAWAARLGV